MVRERGSASAKTLPMPGVLLSTVKLPPKLSTSWRDI
jgi:hypothetical protein